MSDFQAIADRVEIEALRGEFTDAIMMRDYDRFASLFTQDGAWRIPYINAEFVSREEIRAGIERLQGLWDYFVQTAHPGTIQLEGDTSTPRRWRARRPRSGGPLTLSGASIRFGSESASRRRVGRPPC